MHSKQTVKYICEQFSSGHDYYFKQEYITHDKWSNLDSVAWSAPRPIRKETFLKRKKQGYLCEYVQKQTAVILPFHKKANASK
ncbi:hypothetical protein [Shouchella clausii]|uniref:hypothetical protein n=1 Tax=Shouchella TaxID=2893057 RepID=UPI000BA554AE|nr:hypothetical protein [Shouchella clausii]MCM3312529.1 hypothetical protein [Psychrobacillus sp. MER TA 17]MBX0318449.1 hypothetical protein [Shouchella clausii]MDO7283008.1 hypothetical protein [Shouchella clausii]MDO7303105.1 hypothetical protein [Shouchella clausii]PAE84419.1 hypothetical protein CHH77_04225 [Shouchella clausii]